MSIARCEFCDRNIDTDFNLEHFNEDGICMLESGELEKIEMAHPHTLIEKGKLYDALKESHSKISNRLENGRHYLMGAEPGSIMVEDALEALGYGRNGLKS